MSLLALETKARVAEEELASCAAELAKLLAGEITGPSPTLAKLRAENAELQAEYAELTARLAPPADAVDGVEADSDVEAEDLNLHVAVCRIRRRGAIKRKSVPPKGVRTLKSLAASQVRTSLFNGSDRQREWICERLPPNVHAELGWIAKVQLRRMQTSVPGNAVAPMVSVQSAGAAIGSEQHVPCADASDGSVRSEPEVSVGQDTGAHNRPGRNTEQIIADVAPVVAREHQNSRARPNNVASGSAQGVRTDPLTTVTPRDKSVPEKYATNRWLIIGAITVVIAFGVLRQQR
eukprot:m.62301 g.62301  ORF g.62301 m.62301 type:complete len:292 (+) comp9610_c1_seq1:229-1104(+)